MKVALYDRVYALAERYNITQITVHEIINSYINYCKSELYNGREVQILGLVTLVPDKICSDYKTTLAYECRQIAGQIGLPSNTVFTIIREYIRAVEQDILQGNNVDMRGLVSFHMVKTGDELRLHSAISTTIREELWRYNTPVTAVRVHTHKLIKYKLKEA